MVNDANIAKANGAAYSNDALTGGLLNLAMIDFYLNCNKDVQEIGGLTGALPIYNVVACGIATANSTVQDTGSGGNLQIRYLPDAMGIDVGGNWNSTSIDEAAVASLSGKTWPYADNSTPMPTEDVQHYTLMAYDSSSWESLVWEDLTNTPTICTTKAIEMAYQFGTTNRLGLKVETFNASNIANIANDLSALGSGSEAQQIISDIETYVAMGNDTYSVTVPTSLISVGGGGANSWQGVGYFVTDANGIVRANMIDGGWGGVMQAPHGGSTGGYSDYVPTNFLTQDNIYQTYGVTGDPIEVSTGDVLHDETDISIPNLGSPLGMARHYDSINTVASGNDWSDRGMGEGWSFTYSDELVPSTSLGDPLDNDPANTLVWFTDGGVELKFTPNGSGWTTPNGIFGRLTHDAQNPWYLWTDTNGTVTAFYDGTVPAAGRMAFQEDRYGDGVVIDYKEVNGTIEIDTVQRVLNYTAVPSDCCLKFTYTGSHITAITAFDSSSDTTGRTWRYGYNSAGRLVSVTDPISATSPLSLTQYSYYPEGTVEQGLLQSVTDADGNKTQFSYYVNRRGFQVTDAQGNTQTVSHDIYCNQADFTDERGVTTSYTYDSQGRELQVLYADGTTQSCTWNSSDLKLSDTDQYGQKTNYTYDSYGNLLTSTNPLGEETVYTYSDDAGGAYNLPLSVTRQSDGSVTTYKYYTQGFRQNSSPNQYGADYCLWETVVTVNATTSDTTSYTYPGQGTNPGTNYGQPAAVTSPNGNASPSTYGYGITWYVYNDAGQVTTEFAPVATTSNTRPTSSTYVGLGYIMQTFAYNARGQLTSSTDGDGNTTNYTYDVLGHMLTKTQPDPDCTGPLAAPVTDYIYDADGNLISTTLATASPQETTTIVYDSMGRVVKTISPDGTYTTDEYDAAGNVVASTDAMGRVTQSVYDSHDWQTATIEPDGSVLLTQYDGGGRVVARTDALGNTTRYQYDKLGRKTEVIAPYANISSAVTIDDSGSVPAFTASPTGAWSTSSSSNGGGYAGGVDSEYKYTATTGATATWTFSQSQNVVAGSYYEVFVTWVAASANTTKAQFTVYDGSTSGTNRGMTQVNEQTHPPANANFSDAGWLDLGLFYIASGTLTVQLANGDSGTLVADAVRIIQVSPTCSYYDDANDKTYVTNAEGYTTDQNGTISVDINHTTETDYNKIGQVTTVIQPAPASGQPRPTTSYGYDYNGNLTQVTNPNGDWTGAWYDESNRRVWTGNITNGVQYSYLGTAYDDDGNVISTLQQVSAESSGPGSVYATTTYKYDNLDRKIEEIDAPDASDEQPTTNYTYNQNGELASTTDADGNTTTYAYSVAGEQTQVTDALGDTTTAVYDAVGNILLATNALGATTAYQYDSMNRKIAVAEPLPDANTNPAAPQEVEGQFVGGGGPTTTWTYDLSGNVVSTTDPNGNTTWTQYNGWNLPVAVTDALGAYEGDPQHTTTTTYDALGNVLTVTDQLGRTTEYVYDNLGRKVEAIAPDPTTGQASTTDSACPTTYYGYDANGNVKYTTTPMGDPGAGMGGTGAGYPAYTTWYFYDGLNRQICVIGPLAGLTLTTGGMANNPPASPTYAVTTTYNALGDVLTTTDQMGRTTTYQYDNLGRKVEELDPTAYSVVNGTETLTQATTTYTYDRNGNVLSTTDPDGNTTWTTYDALNRPIRSVSADGNGPNDKDYATTTVYNAVGNVLSTTDPDGNVTSYSYDRLSRQVSETNPLQNTSTTQYDANGNVIQTTDFDGQVIQYAYNAVNEQVEENWLANGSSFHTIQTTYDAAGQVTSVIEWDTQNASAGARYQYVYDQDGRLVRSRMAPDDLQQPGPLTYTIPLNAGTYNFDGQGQEPYNGWYYSGVQVGDVIQATVQSSAFTPGIVIMAPSGAYGVWWAAAGSQTITVDFTATAAGDWTIFAIGPAGSSTSETATLQTQIDPAVPVALTELDYTYYADGSVKTVSDSSNVSGLAAKTGTTTYAYNSDSDVAQITQSGTGATNKDVQFTYNADDSLDTISRYNGLNSSAPLVATTSYRTTTGGAGSGYDGMGRVTNMQQETYGSSPTTVSYSWQYDVASNVAQATNSIDGADAYTVDHSDQLTSALADQPELHLRPKQ